MPLKRIFGSQQLSSLLVGYHEVSIFLYRMPMLWGTALVRGQNQLDQPKHLTDTFKTVGQRKPCSLQQDHLMCSLNHQRVATHGVHVLRTCVWRDLAGFFFPFLCCASLVLFCQVRHSGLRHVHISSLFPLEPMHSSTWVLFCFCFLNLGWLGHQGNLLDSVVTQTGVLDGDKPMS